MLRRDHHLAKTAVADSIVVMGRQQRRAILVLGVHRSGTSALARVVNLLGITLATDLYDPSDQNPTGYWESQFLVGLDEWVLESAGATWSNCLGFSLEQLDSPHLTGIMASLVQGTTRMFGDIPLFAMKDPRLCLLLDVWLPALRSLEIEVSALISLRSPLAVARSLSIRNGFSLPQAMALWLRYMLAAEAGTRSIRRSIVCYDALLADWRTTMDRAEVEIGLTWPRGVARAAAEVAAFLRPDLRHHDAIAADGDAIPWQIQTWANDSYAAFQDLARSAAHTGAVGRLDQIRTEVSAWCRTMRSFAASGASRG